MITSLVRDIGPQRVGHGLGIKTSDQAPDALPETPGIHGADGASLGDGFGRPNTAHASRKHEVMQTDSKARLMSSSTGNST